METIAETGKMGGGEEFGPSGKEQEIQRSGVWRTLEMQRRWNRMDAVDRFEEVLVWVEISGVEKKELLPITASPSKLLCSARKKRGNEVMRTLPLPATVDGSKAKAVFRDGVLELPLPKKEGSQWHSVKLDWSTQCRLCRYRYSATRAG